MHRVAGSSFVGARKSVNQDAYCALCARTPFGDAALVAVCDGVGGLSSGELASSVAVRELSRWFEQDFAGIVAGPGAGRPGIAACPVPRADAWVAVAQASLESLVGDLNSRMRRYGSELNVRLGTTLTALVVHRGRFLVAHVGDCRAYRLGEEGAAQLTRDQTLIQAEVDAGRIGAREALTHPKGSAILQAVGACDAVTPAFTQGTCRAGELFLVCSDGLYRRQGERGIEEALARAGDAEDELLDALGDLTAAALDAGEGDNITGVLLRVEGPLPDALPAGVCSASSAAPQAGQAPALLADDEPTLALGGGE